MATTTKVFDYTGTVQFFTIPAGTTIFLRITANQLTSGLAIGYRETDGDTTA